MLDVIEIVETHQWEIPAYKVDEFKAEIARANSKLARIGLDARFEITYTDFAKQVRRGGLITNEGQVLIEGTLVEEPWVRAELTGPLTLSHGHYTFVARLVPEEAGVTVHSAPGQELGGYAPNGTNGCDHCGVNRNRNRLYLVRDERDGNILQLGHSCIELYTGVAPKGLWALTFDEELTHFTSDDREGGFGARDYGAPVDLVLAYAFAHSDKGRNYIPSGGYDATSTVAHVRTSLFFDIARLKDRERDYYLAKAAEAATYATDAELITEIRASVAETDENSDYGRTLRIILAGTSVSGRNVGILASLCKVYARKMQLEAERRAAPIAAGFLGDIKERIKNISFTLTTVLLREDNYGTKTLLVGRTEDGHVVKWWAARALDIEVGDTLTLEAATVKAHENYKGIDQTVITRGTIDDFDERATGLAAAIEANDGNAFEPIKQWVQDGTAETCSGTGHWEVVGYDETQPLADRWLKSKAEKKRFAAWLTANR